MAKNPNSLPENQCIPGKQQGKEKVQKAECPVLALQPEILPLIIISSISGFLYNYICLQHEK
jgi:hypothetical protein